MHRVFAVFEIGRGHVYGDLFASERRKVQRRKAQKRPVEMVWGGKERPRVRVSLLIYNAVSAR